MVSTAVDSRRARKARGAWRDRQLEDVQFGEGYPKRIAIGCRAVAVAFLMLLSTAALACVQTAQCDDAVSCGFGEVCYLSRCYPVCNEEGDCNDDQRCAPCYLEGEDSAGDGRCEGANAAACVPAE